MSDTIRSMKRGWKMQMNTPGFYLLALQTLGLILLYYSFSIGLTFYQKWLMQSIKFPLTVVMCHLIIKFLLAWLCRCIWKSCKTKELVTIGWEPSLTRLLPMGAASAMDIGLSNWSLELITVSLYTMTKSTAIIFILIFALVFKVEKMHWSLFAIVLSISGGLCLFTYKTTEFNVEGFFLAMSASFLSGLRWTLAQLVTQKSNLGLDNPIHMVYHIQPWMMITLLPFAVGVEGVSLVNVFHSDNIGIKEVTSVGGEIIAAGFLAFFMEMSEFLVVTFTSSLTLSVAGIFKEISTLSLAIAFNGDQISWINFIGLLLCMGGIVFHVVFKALYSTVTDDVMSKVSNQKEKVQLHLPLLVDEESEDDIDIVYDRHQTYVN